MYFGDCAPQRQFFSYFVLGFYAGISYLVLVISYAVWCAEQIQIVMKVPNYTGLDLISRLILQFPCAFEFNEQFLITVLDHLTRYDEEYFAEFLSTLFPRLIILNQTR